MTQKRKATRKRSGAPPASTPQQLYLHHIEEASVHLNAARQVWDSHLTGIPTKDYDALRAIGRNIATLYRRAGGNPDATR